MTVGCFKFLLVSVDSFKSFTNLVTCVLYYRKLKAELKMLKYGNVKYGTSEIRKKILLSTVHQKSGSTNQWKSIGHTDPCKTLNTSYLNIFY